MSQASAIAAVTETLRALLGREGEVPDVTSLPPDQAEAAGGRRVNLFLYHLGIDTALRNQEFPWQGRSGGNSQKHPPPFVLPLQLHYLLTVYDQDEVAAHGALGSAMLVLHDHAQLTKQEIRLAADSAGLDSDLHLQPENVKVTPLNMSADEMMKIWTAFQKSYRLSVAYEVSVVLIESQRPSFSALPVLRRGADDRGPVAIPGNIEPVITALLRANGSSPFTTGFAGDVLIIEGVNLGTAPRVRLRRVSDHNAANTSQITATRLSSDAPGGSATAERCQLPLVAAGLPAAGPLALSIEVSFTVEVPDDVNPGKTKPETRTWRSNEVVLCIAPRILNVLPIADADPITVTLQIEPGAAPDQRAVLLLDGREHPAQLDTTNPDRPELTFVKPNPGTYRARLRLDGVDLPEITTDATTGHLKFVDDKTVDIP